MVWSFGNASRLACRARIAAQELRHQDALGPTLPLRSGGTKGCDLTAAG